MGEHFSLKVQNIYNYFMKHYVQKKELNYPFLKWHDPISRRTKRLHWSATGTQKSLPKLQFMKLTGKQSTAFVFTSSAITEKEFAKSVSFTMLAK